MISTVLFVCDSECEVDETWYSGRVHQRNMYVLDSTRLLERFEKWLTEEMIEIKTCGGWTLRVELNRISFWLAKMQKLISYCMSCSSTTCQDREEPVWQMNWTGSHCQSSIDYWNWHLLWEGSHCGHFKGEHKKFSSVTAFHLLTCPITATNGQRANCNSSWQSR